MTGLNSLVPFLSQNKYHAHSLIWTEPIHSCRDQHTLYKYGVISMAKFNNQELISNYPNCTCIYPKLNSNKPILCFKSGMHVTEGQKPVSGIMQLVKMEEGILSGKRHNVKRHKAKRHNAKRHNA